jgi:hypothetical protein
MTTITDQRSYTVRSFRSAHAAVASEAAAVSYELEQTEVI